MFPPHQQNSVMKTKRRQCGTTWLNIDCARSTAGVSASVESEHNDIFGFIGSKLAVMCAWVSRRVMLRFFAVSASTESRSASSHVYSFKRALWLAVAWKSPRPPPSLVWKPFSGVMGRVEAIRVLSRCERRDCSSAGRHWRWPMVVCGVQTTQNTFRPA